MKTGENIRGPVAWDTREDLDRAARVLDTIVREGGSEVALRKIASAVAQVPGLGRTTLWALRAEDGLYVEVARSENGGGAGFPALPAEARRAEPARRWLAGLPSRGEILWFPPGRGSTGPRSGSTILVPLARHDARHPPGLLLVRAQETADPSRIAESLGRWADLARLALATAAVEGAGRARVEEVREEKRRLQELHRTKSQFIAAVSHELRTPLTSISAYAEALRSPDVAGAEQTREKFLKVIHEESRRLTRIVDEILDLATMDSGRVRIACRPIDVVEVLRGAQEVIHPIAERRGVRIAPLCGEPATVSADPDLMKQLAVNLLENAVRFSDEDGEVRVSVETQGSAVRICVEDDGTGIPPAELDAIFERFYQVDPARGRAHAGSGLGLAICKSIVTWHDGRIWAESGKGRGARFVISLPRTRAVSHRDADASAETGRREHRIPELLIEMIAEVVGADAVSLMVLDPSGAELFIQAAVGIPDEAVRDVRLAMGERIAGHVAETGKALLIPDIDSDSRFPPSAKPEQYRTRSLLSVPVRLRDETIGVINVTNKSSGEALGDHDLNLVEMLAERVALVMHKLRDFGDRRDAIGRMEDAIRSVIDVRRHYFPSCLDHTRLVLALCDEMHVEPQEASRIHYASIVRDVGMVRLPEGVYRKPVRLSPQDRERIRRHPEEGATTIRPIELESGVFDVILAHHEEADGTGYPRGLSGDGIPRGARILAVVDAYDALRTGRPYKDAVDADAAVEELRAHAGRQFDAEVVDALVRILEKRGDLSDKK